ncbi:MAG: ABC transporter substrate binding protein (PQQ-dependent alcohol dehydrogenase system) [Parasphingorhabdus sp.]|jgi:ABC transporter substrate binding protein (PQQ-dependent alcohol dehydrogenase system)
MRLTGIIFILTILHLPALALSASNDAVQTVNIGYAEIIDDLRYEEKRAYARIRVKPHHRPIAGAEVAIRESKILGRALKMKFNLKLAEAIDADALITRIKRMYKEDNVAFFIVDADAKTLTAIANATTQMDILLFNISDYSDWLRGAGCHPRLMHVIPGYAMLTDALSQFLMFKKWRKVLLLKGPEPEDAAFAAAFSRSARRFGIKIIEEREFLPGNDPRNREQNNITLMTSGTDADLIFVADIEGEFGRYVQYQTNTPLPVFGTEGLQASSWHWSWERHGAPQLNQRFEKNAKRRMQGPDWAAWAAVRSIIESILRSRSTEFEKVVAYLRSAQLNLDAYKGAPVSYRPWDNQLRQPILLHSYNATIDRAPIRGFLHPEENMDTLGYDQVEQRCR